MLIATLGSTTHLVHLGTGCTLCLSHARPMEELFENTMKQHGAWIRMEEYELSLSDEQIRALFDCFARVEELLNITPLDKYSNLVELFYHSLRSRTFPSSELTSGPPQDHVHAPEEDGTEGIDIKALFERMYIAKGTKDDYFKLKEAGKVATFRVCSGGSAAGTDTYGCDQTRQERAASAPSVPIAHALPYGFSRHRRSHSEERFPGMKAPRPCQASSMTFQKRWLEKVVGLFPTL